MKCNDNRIKKLQGKNAMTDTALSSDKITIKIE
jgi:hypothetical protein